MFKNLFKKNNSKTEIVAPVAGELIALEEVPDPVFSQKMMGDGIAIKPSDNQILAPVDGEVVQLPETKHAVGLRTEDGIEILIHIGLETVSLNGEGFTPNVKIGDQVTKGDQLMTCDFGYIRENASNDITPIVITNGQDTGKTFTMTEENNGQAGETVIITASEK